MSSGALFATSFLASAVEAIEMVAVVVGVGATRGWRSSLVGAGVGLVVLAVLSAALGSALRAIPIDVLRLVVGALLLVFGLGWLKKGMRRVSAKGLRGDEEHLEGGDVRPGRLGIDPTSFVLSFKAVVLEGLEIAFIVVSFGATGRNVPVAAAGGVGALVLIAGLGAAFHRLLTRIPRSLLILVVGVLLSTFGSFWSVEGVGASWPGDEAALLGLLALYSGVAAAGVGLLRRRRLRPRPLGRPARSWS